MHRKSFWKCSMSENKPTSFEKKNILAFQFNELEQYIVENKFPKFRAKQIWNWLYENGVMNFSLMKNIPQKIIEHLEEHFFLGNMSVDMEQSSKDGKIKRLYKLQDGQLIESVLMPYNDGRRTACISSQAGCAMRCVFCATGQMGFSRQLTKDEIVEQVLHFDL